MLDAPPMKAFAEQICPCGTLILRVGPDTDRAPKHFDYMLALTYDDVVKGMAQNPERDDVGTFTRQHWNAIQDEIKRLNRKWRYDRQNHNKERKFEMAKEKINNISEIFSADGKLNKGVAAKGVAHALKQMDGGHYDIEAGTASQTEVSPKRVRINIQFDRVEK